MIPEQKTVFRFAGMVSLIRIIFKCLYKALHYFYNDSRTKNGFPFCGDGFVTDTIPIFYSIIKSRRHTANMTTGTGTIEGILPAIVTTLPQAGYAYIIAQSALFQKRS
nr:MAG TPA: hypothetical protein [Caudoviricetes sp.]